MRGVRRPVALLADVLAVLAFVLLGRRSHDEGSLVAGTVATALPFLAGAGAGHLALRVARRRPDTPAGGAVVLAAAVGVGMALRRLAGGGTPPSFVVVTTGFLALLLLGWRLAARLVGGRRGAPADAHPANRPTERPAGSTAQGPAGGGRVSGRP